MRLLIVAEVASGVALAIGLSLVACGTTVVEPTDELPDAGTDATKPPGDAAVVHDADAHDVSFDRDATVEDVLPDYVDPGCPDADPPPVENECDPYHQDNGDCPPGYGCYIFVKNPKGPCEEESYGSSCAASGTATQGEACDGGLDCAAGYECVITGSGTQCVKLCPLEGGDGCPPGLVCEPIDVKGFGGCL